MRAAISDFLSLIGRESGAAAAAQARLTDLLDRGFPADRDGALDDARTPTLLDVLLDVIGSAGRRKVVTGSATSATVIVHVDSGFLRGEGRFQFGGEVAFCFVDIEPLVVVQRSNPVGLFTPHELLERFWYPFLARCRAVVVDHERPIGRKLARTGELVIVERLGFVLRIIDAHANSIPDARTTQTRARIVSSRLVNAR
jgi:hypothetical protein